jgi:cytochrome c oxidase subunit 2
MTSGGIRQHGSKQVIAVVMAGMFALAAGSLRANPVPWQMNMTKGVTTYSKVPYDLNMISLSVCTVIGVLVFGAMFIAMFRFRKSRGAVAEKWSHNTMVEIIWTTIPVLILVCLAWLSTEGMRKFYDLSGSQMTIKVTGYQWKWRYDYVDYQGKPISHVGFMSKLDELSNETRQLDSGLDPYAVKTNGYNTYLLNVDHPLVVPIHTKIRFLIGSGDVIHAWFVPAFGWQMDAIPGMINTAWANITKPGVYRGQCAYLCGQDHAFMPIVVKAVSRKDFAKWLEAREKAATPAPAASTATPEAAQVSSPQPAGQG